MYLLVPDASNKRVLRAGTVVGSTRQIFVAEMEESIDVPVGKDVNAFGDVRGKFYQQGAVVTELRQIEPRSIIAFKRVGEPVSAENRQTFRVCVVAAGIVWRIGEEAKCQVVDICAEGFAAITVKSYELGSLVPVVLSHGGQFVSTPMRVQTVKQRPGGKFRYGFYAPDNKSPARKVLEQVSAMIQRQHLRRIAGAA